MNRARNPASAEIPTPLTHTFEEVDKHGRQQEGIQERRALARRRPRRRAPTGRRPRGRTSGTRRPPRRSPPRPKSGGAAASKKKSAPAGYIRFRSAGASLQPHRQARLKRPFKRRLCRIAPWPWGVSKFEPATTGSRSNGQESPWPSTTTWLFNSKDGLIGADGEGKVDRGIRVGRGVRQTKSASCRRWGRSGFIGRHPPVSAQQAVSRRGGQVTDISSIGYTEGLEEPEIFRIATKLSKTLSPLATAEEPRNPQALCVGEALTDSRRA